MLTILVEAYNEEKTIGSTLDSLIDQVDENGNEIDKKVYRIVIILSKKSTDQTEEIVKAYMKEHSNVEMHLVKDNGTGFVDARLCGIQYIKKNLNEQTEYIALCDADLSVPNRWIYTILSIFKNTDNEIISFAGTFPTSFWIKVPNLARKYYEKVGTIFFNEDINRYYRFDKKCLFTENLFQRFGRPVSGGCYAIRKDTYLKNGGYKKEYRDSEQKYELDGPTWRMMFKIYRKKTKIFYYNMQYFQCSERRMVANPQEFFSIKDFDKMNIMENYRNVDEWMYQRIDSMADKIDFQPIRYYVIEYYIFLWCINNNALLVDNRDFFGELYNDIYMDIVQWNAINNEPTSLQVFDYAHNLRIKYADKLLDIRRKNVYE